MWQGESKNEERPVWSLGREQVREKREERDEEEEERGACVCG
jgi:hypothetical protein